MNADSRNDAHRLTLAEVLLAAVLLGLLIAAFHGSAATLGLFMDDHAHYRQLRACDWSLAGLTDACRLELVGGTIELWWLPDVTLRFFRPVAFGLMKLTYTLVGWHAPAMHTVSLVWHLAVCVLLFVLLRRCGLGAWLAGVCSGLFAIHPGHVATVQWIACQTELMVTALLLGATLCFGRFRGWPGFAPAERVGGVRWAVAVGVLFALALGCRENAVMFPVVLLAVEPLVGRAGRRRALVVYGVLGVLLGAYLALRMQQLGGAALPPKPYVHTPADPEFGRFVFDKAGYYLLAQFLAIPCVPIAGLSYLQERPVLFYGLAGVVALVVILVAVRFVRRPPGLLGPAWLIAFMVPLLPVFASPHHLYLPGVGWALTLGLLLRGMCGRVAGPPADGRCHTVRNVGGAVVAVACALLFGTLTAWQTMAIRTGHDVEACLTAELAASPRGLHDGDTLYIANLPLVGHYTRLALEHETGLRDLRVVPLTWAPRVLGLVTPAELNVVDDRTIEVRVAQERYFAGALDRIIRAVTGGPVPDAADAADKCGLRVQVLERDADGIAALRFTFERPLSDPGKHLFWGSRARWACEIMPRTTP